MHINTFIFDEEETYEHFHFFFYTDFFMNSQ